LVVTLCDEQQLHADILIQFLLSGGVFNKKVRTVGKPQYSKKENQVRIRIELAEKQWFDLVHEVISLIT
jgi:hypothetical protein